MGFSLVDLIRALARRHVIDEEAAAAPKPETEAEQEYLDLTRWTADDLRLVRKGKQIHPPPE